MLLPPGRYQAEGASLLFRRGEAAPRTRKRAGQKKRYSANLCAQVQVVGHIRRRDDTTVLPCSSRGSYLPPQGRNSHPPHRLPGGPFGPEAT